jgi:hypothetical protein
MDFAQVTALATVAGVLVALFGPFVYSAYIGFRRSPRLTLRAASTNERLFNGPAEGITLELANSHGRDRAQDVEIFLTGDGQDPGEDFLWHLAGQTPILVGNDYATSVAAGFSRLFALGWLPYGQAEQDKGLGMTAGSVATLQQPEVHKFRIGSIYDIAIVVTGSNFDACAWKGRLSIEREDRDDGTVAVYPKWLAPVSRVRVDRI